MISITIKLGQPGAHVRNDSRRTLGKQTLHKQVVRDSVFVSTEKKKHTHQQKSTKRKARSCWGCCSTGRPVFRMLFFSFFLYIVASITRVLTGFPGAALAAALDGGRGRFWAAVRGLVLPPFGRRLGPQRRVLCFGRHHTTNQRP